MDWQGGKLRVEFNLGNRKSDRNRVYTVIPASNNIETGIFNLTEVQE